MGLQIASALTGVPSANDAVMMDEFELTKKWVVDEQGDEKKHEINPSEKTKIVLDCLSPAMGVKDEMIGMAKVSSPSISSLNVIKGVKVFGYITNTLSLGVAANDMVRNGLSANNGSDAVTGIAAFIPGGGWLIGSITAVGKYTTNRFMQNTGQIKPGGDMLNPKSYYGPRFIDAPIRKIKNPNSL